ncbi:hypothetical protein BGY98DRAFT_978597 [Russula aff. rugulosa BPL654]|nr:hypothetical protein BGY98DRAFT_978597 [Russula aff. rugulosa BPL654]
MHRYKIVPMTLLILSSSASCVLEDVIPVSQSQKRSDRRYKDEYSDGPWQKRGSAQGSNPAPPVGELPADKELATNSPPSPSPQTGTSRIQDAASAPSPEIKQPPSDEITPSDHGYMSSENYHATGEGSGSPDSAEIYPPSNRPEMASDGPGPDLASTEGTRPAGSIMSRPLLNGPEIGSFPLWDPHDWSETSSEAEKEPKEDLMSKTKSFFDKLVYKFKFWPRGPGEL